MGTLGLDEGMLFILPSVLVPLVARGPVRKFRCAAVHMLPMGVVTSCAFHGWAKISTSAATVDIPACHATPACWASVLYAGYVPRLSDLCLSRLFY